MVQSFSPLTGIDVFQTYLFSGGEKFRINLFQSPYGD